MPMASHRVSEKNEKRMYAAAQKLLQKEKIGGYTFDDVLGLVLEEAGF